MLNRLLFLIAITSCSISFGQDETVTEVSESEMTKSDFPYAVIENVPIYPGCVGKGNQELKNCMSTRISKFVNSNFNVNKFQSLNLAPNVYRVAVQFKIDKEGKVVDVRARAPHYEIEKEAIRVVSNLPQMVPGKQRGEAVGVLYSLPIAFEIEAPKTIETKKNKRKAKN